MKKIEFVEPKAIEAVECALCGKPTERVEWSHRGIALVRRFDGRFFNAQAAVVVNEEKLDVSICGNCTAIACVEWAFAVDEHTAARVAKERLNEYALESSGV